MRGDYGAFGLGAGERGFGFDAPGYVGLVVEDLVFLVYCTFVFGI